VSRSRLPTAGRVVLIAFLAVVAVVAGYAATYGARHKLAHRTPQPTPTTPAAYSAAGSPPAVEPTPTAPMPAASGVRRSLAGLIGAPGLGPRLLGEVVDVATGTVLYHRASGALAAPASTGKLLTATAVLADRSAGYRIRTTVRAGTGGAIVLVGGGDPTLTGAAKGKPGAYAGAARISDLADQVRAAGVRPTRILVDDSLFTGPTVSPLWAPEDVPSDYASAITPVLADGGRATPEADVRSATPDLAAGRALAAALGRPALPVGRGVAPAGARELAGVSSAPIGRLVQQMLTTSDNVIAECLARQVALVEGRPVTFTGGAAAVKAVLARLGVAGGDGMRDGSGLAASDRVSPAALTTVLRLSAARSALRDVVAGLPVAAWSGTLASRYLRGSARAGAGVVRAKTGTLTGVSSLAGTVHDRSGRLLAFAFMADRTGSTEAAEAALDALAARLAGCGCS
jgi:serine-type D-Ala-D-Ala carboxypeptidase/endopeptidase (penicillin-binding protein 4)